MSRSDDSSRLFDVTYVVSFFSVLSTHRLPVKYWFDACSVLFCSDEIIWLLICSFCIVWDDDEDDDDKEAAGGGGGALAFLRAPGDLKKIIY